MNSTRPANTLTIYLYLCALFALLVSGAFLLSHANDSIACTSGCAGVDAQGHGTCGTSPDASCGSGYHSECRDTDFPVSCGDTTCPAQSGMCISNCNPKTGVGCYTEGYYQSSYEGSYQSYYQSSYEGYYQSSYEGCYGTCGNPPICSGGGPAAASAILSAGSMQVNMYGVEAAFTGYFRVWGSVGGQDDITTYTATNPYSGSTWVATVPFANHKPGNPEYGTINVQGYLSNADYQNVLCSSFTFTLSPNPPPPTCASVGVQSPATITIINTATELFLYAYGVTNATQVQFPTWGPVGTAGNTQDDIVWYSGTNMGGGTWRAKVELGNHKVGSPEYGTFIVHVYMGNASNWPIWCGATSFDRIQTGTVQGYKLDQNYAATLTPGATILVAGQAFGFSTNPYIATVASGAQTVSSTVPAGYSVAYSLCTNCTSHPPNSFINGSSVSISVPAGGYSDLYWRYTPLPADITTSNKDVVAVNGKTMVYHWDDGVSEALISGTSPAEGGIVRFGVHVRNTSTAITSDIVVTDHFTNMVMPTGGWSATIKCDNLTCATHTLDPTIIYNAGAKTATFTIHPNGGSLASGHWITLFFDAQLQGPTGTTANVFRFINQADIGYTENTIPKSVACGSLSPCPLKTPATVFYRSLTAPGVEEVR